MRVLASKDSDLMAQDQDLEVLGAVVTARADHEASQGTDREGDQGEHRGMVADRTGFSTPRLEPSLERLGAKADPGLR